MGLLPFGKQKKKTTSQSNDNNVKNLYPIKDVFNDSILLKDGTHVKAIKLEAVNFNLLSQKKQEQYIRFLYEAYNALNCKKQIIILPRPVDLDNFIQGLTEKKDKETHVLKRMLLQGYIREGAQIAASGEATDLLFYILLSEKEENLNHLNLNLDTLQRDLNSAHLNAKICDENNLRELLYIFMNPIQSAYERSPKDSGPFVDAIYE